MDSFAASGVVELYLSPHYWWKFMVNLLIFKTVNYFYKKIQGVLQLSVEMTQVVEMMAL